jgi:membrane fusion protein, multidrug efflux system
VQRGDVLIRLDDRTEQAQLKSAEATRKLADSGLQRSVRLTRANANSASDSDVAEAELARAAAMADQLRVMIDKKIMRAPFNARVGLFDLHVGQYLVEGSEITTLEGVADYFNIDFAMPSHVADAIAIGDNVELRVGDAKQPLTAAIVAVDASADAISRSVTARAMLRNPPPMLQPNDSVHVTVFYGPPIPVRLIPATAVRRGPSGTVVYVASELDGAIRAHARNVVVAGSDDLNVRVFEGIEAGDRVVADGSFKVHEGALLADVQKSVQAEPIP